jgi:putative protease
MKFVTYAESKHDISQIKEKGIEEVILSNKDLSRYSKVSSLIELATFAKELNLKVVLEWDILITEVEFGQSINDFQKVPVDLYDVVRVQDAGVLEYVLTETKKPVQFITESGNHNLIGLKKWVSYIGERLDRLVLSIELNKTKLEDYCKELNCETELLVLGQVLLFYSPRKLLSVLKTDEDEKRNKQIVTSDFLEALGESEESPHKGFPLLENKHGTFMFHIKDLFLLDKYEELSLIGLTHLRVDIRHKSDSKLLDLIVSEDSIESKFIALKEHYGKDVIRGYFQVNKSDVLFKKLKNYRIQRKGSSYLGEVVEIVKGEYLAINIKTHNDIRTNDELKFITPEGKELLCKVHFLKDVSYGEIDSQSKGQLALMNYLGGVWPKSQVYLQ